MDCTDKGASGGATRPKCSVCRDLRCVDIENALKAGRSDRFVSREFGLHRATIKRHREHMAGIAEPEHWTSSLETFLEDIKSTAADDRTKIMAARELRSLRMDRERVLQHSDETQLTNHPAWHAHLKWLAGILNDCARCKEALSTKYPGDTRTE